MKKLYPTVEVFREKGQLPTTGKTLDGVIKTSVRLFVDEAEDMQKAMRKEGFNKRQRMEWANMAVAQYLNLPMDVILCTIYIEEDQTFGGRREKQKHPWQITLDLNLHKRIGDLEGELKATFPKASHLQSRIIRSAIGYKCTAAGIM